MEKETFPDAAVVALSKNFVWVTINRDHGGRDLCKQYNVSAYPSLLVFGKKDEKVFRFSGFKKPVDFLPKLKEGLRRHALYVAGKEWDTPDPRPDVICSKGTIETFPAPSEGGPSGITFVDGKLWIAQEGKLYAATANGEFAGALEIARSVRDLCTDGSQIYAMEYGWTAGKPIHVLDAAGRAVRQIVTEANKANRSMGAAGIAWKDGKLYVLEGMRGKLNEIDPKTGEVTRVLDTGARWLSGLDFDGTHFVAGSRKGLHFLDGATGKQVRMVATSYPLRVVAAHGGAYYLLEQAIFGHDKKHKRVRVFPERVLVHKLTLPAAKK